MKTIPLPSQEYLRECFDYDPDAGVLTWKARPLSHFKSVRGMRIANTRHSGSPVSRLDGGGYVEAGVSGVPLKAHRIIWMLCYGADPIEVDHVNHNKTDNRLVNLRAVDHTANSRNRSMSKNNQSGVNGVCWHSKNGKWVARIAHESKNIYLGIFSDKSDAIAARKAAEKQLGFHSNHGRAA